MKSKRSEKGGNIEFIGEKNSKIRTSYNTIEDDGKKKTEKIIKRRKKRNTKYKIQNKTIRKRTPILTLLVFPCCLSPFVCNSSLYLLRLPFSGE